MKELTIDDRIRGGSSRSEKKSASSSANLAKARRNSPNAKQYYYVMQHVDGIERYTSRSKPGKDLAFPDKALRFRTKKAALRNAMALTQEFERVFWVK